MLFSEDQAEESLLERESLEELVRFLNEKRTNWEIGNFQKVSKEEAINWFKQKYEGLVLN